MEQTELIVIHGRAYKAMTKELLERADLASLIPHRDTLVGIKPNLLGQVLASEGGTTHPEVVEGLIEYLQEKGYHNLVLLEGSWVGDTTEQAMKYCGFDRICRDYQVPFWDMQKEKGVKKDCLGMELNLCRRALDIEFLINVPVLKGHCQTRITCALKNMKGLIPNSEKRRFHRLGLHDPIGHLSAGIRQDFILVDSICGDLTFEDGGNPIEQNRLIAARDPVLCDTYGCSLLDIPVESVPYITMAARLGIGSRCLEEAKITELWESNGQETSETMENIGQDAPEIMENGGQDASETTKNSGRRMAANDAVKAASAWGYRKVMKLAERAEEVDSCSACYGYLIPALQMLEQDGLLEKLEEKVCIGQGFRGRCGELGVGNCTRLFAHTVEGCPPTENQIYEFLKNYIMMM